MPNIVLLDTDLHFLETVQMFKLTVLIRKEKISLKPWNPLYELLYKHIFCIIIDNHENNFHYEVNIFLYLFMVFLYKPMIFVSELSVRRYFKKLLGCMCFIFLSWLASVLSTVSIAIFLESMGRTMSWYARPLWVFFLYVIPTLVVSMAAILLHAKLYNKVGKTVSWDSWFLTCIRFFHT